MSSWSEAKDLRAERLTGIRSFASLQDDRKPLVATEDITPVRINCPRRTAHCPLPTAYVTFYKWRSVAVASNVIS